jgi:dihydroflavonol-4-reductase
MHLVTGGAGFIGRHLVRLLLDRGEAVRVLDNALEPRLPTAVEVIRGSVTDASTVRQAMSGVRFVFHAAGNPHLWAARKADFDEINHEGTRVVLAAAQQAGVERVVHTSSGVLFANGQVKRCYTIGPPTLGDTLPGAYARSKLSAERESLAAVARGLPVVIVRPTLIIGPDDRNVTPPTRMLLDLLSGRTPAFLDVELNLIDVRDVARGLWAAAERGQPGHSYALGNTTLRLGALLELLEAMTGVRMPRRRVPYGVALAAAYLTEIIADHISRREPMAPLAGVRLARRLRYPDMNECAALLGLQLTPIRTALGDAIAWFVSSGRLSAQDLPHWTQPERSGASGPNRG